MNKDTKEILYQMIAVFIFTYFFIIQNMEGIFLLFCVGFLILITRSIKTTLKKNKKFK